MRVEARTSSGFWKRVLITHSACGTPPIGSASEGRFYNGGDFKPRSPIFLPLSAHWFGDSGWAQRRTRRFGTMAKFGRKSSRVRLQAELETAPR